MALTEQRTFLVESYVPDLDEATAVDLSARLRSAIDELRQDGLAVRWIRSFALVGEETYIWIVNAADVDEVAVVRQRVALGLDHVVEVAAGEPV